MSDATPNIEVPAATVYSVIHAAAAQRPDKIAFELIGHGKLSYAQLLSQAENAAAALVDAGIGPGDRIALMAGNRSEFLELLIACSRIGAVFVPLGSSLRGQILCNMIKLADPRIVFADADCHHRIQNAWDGECRLLPSPSADPTDWNGDARTLSSIAEPAYASLVLLLFTSGTTGQSKGVMWTNGTVLTMAASTTKVHNLGEDDIMYTALPLSHANGMIMTALAAFTLGAKAVVAPRFSASIHDEQLATTGATFTNILGSMGPILLKAPATNLPLRLKNALTIPITPQVSAGISRRYGCTVTSAYGLSDVGLPILTGWDFPAGSCGRLLSKIWECKLADADGNAVSSGQVGELWIKSKVDGAAPIGYWGMEAETALRYRDGWISTGDMFRIDSDNWCYFIDRAKDAIRRRGENISSHEVEAAVATHPDVVDCAAYPVPSELSEDEVMVAVVRKQGSDLTEVDLIRHVERELPYFAVPRFVRWMDDLPRTDTQKVQKVELRRIGVTAETWDRDRAGYTLSR